MIKIEHGNLSISGSGEETTADLLSVLTGYREMLIEQGGLTPERAGDFMETMACFFGPRMSMPSMSACPPIEVRKSQSLLFAMLSP